MPWVWLSVVPRTSWKGETPAKGRPDTWVPISGQRPQPSTSCRAKGLPAPVVTGSPEVSRSWPWEITNPAGFLTVQIEEASAWAFAATPGPSGASSLERKAPVLSQSR